MSQKIKTAILIVLGLIIILFVWAMISSSNPETSKAPANNNGAAAPQAPVNTANGDLNTPPPPPVFQSSERRFEVTGAKEGQKDTYLTRDLSNNKEVEVFIPSDANITAGKRASIQAGTILTVQKFIELSNNLIATDLSISTKE